MALNVFELFGKIVVDNSGAEKGIDKTVKHAKDAESNLSKTFKKIGGMVAAAFSVRAVVDFGKQCTQAYASIAAEESAFAQIMGDYADTAQAKLNAVADQTGVASTRMTGAMTSLTAKFKGLGYNTADATTLAADGLLIAADASAFWDMSLEESMSHLNSFINGSYEGGEAIGLFANDTQMAAYAIEQGIVKDAKAWAKLDEAQRQATRLAYAKQMMESSGATGQAAKEADAYANVMANLKEHWRQFQGIIGKPILEKLVLPAMQKLNNFMPKLNEAVQNGIVWLDEGFGKIKGYFEEVFTEDGINLDALPDALTNMFSDLGRSVGSLLSSFGQKMKNGWNNTVWPMIQKTFKAVFGIELPDWATVKQNISDGWNKTVWPSVQGLFKTVFGIDVPDWATVKQNITDGWNNTVWPAIQGLFKAVFGVESPEWETVKADISDGWNNTVWPAVQGFFKKEFKIDLPSWTDLNTKISNSWNKTVWPAIKDFFSPIFTVNPEDEKNTAQRIINWWNNKVKPLYATLFEETFGVKPEDADGTEVGAKIRDWWELCKAAYGDIFKETFGVNPEDGYAVGAKIRDWWDTVVEAYKSSVNIFKEFFTVNPEDADGKTTAQKLLDWWDSVKTSFDANMFRGFFGVEPGEEPTVTASRIINWFNSVLKYIGDIFKGFFGIEPEEDAETEATNITTWWAEVLKGLGEKMFDFAFNIDLPDISKVVADIKKWWEDVLKDVKLSLPFGLGNLFGSGEGEGEDGEGKEDPWANWKPIESSFSLPEDNSSTPTTDGSWNPNLRNLYRFPGIDGTGGSNTVQNLIAAINAQQAEIQGMYDNVTAAIADGFSGMTVTNNVSVGNVNLDGQKVGTMTAPWVNLELGWICGRR